MTELIPFYLSDFEKDIIEVYLKHFPEDTKLYELSSFTIRGCLTNEAINLTLKEYYDKCVEYMKERGEL